MKILTKNLVLFKPKMTVFNKSCELTTLPHFFNRIQSPGNVICLRNKYAVAKWLHVSGISRRLPWNSFNKKIIIAETLVSFFKNVFCAFFLQQKFDIITVGNYLVGLIVSVTICNSVLDSSYLHKHLAFTGMRFSLRKSLAFTVYATLDIRVLD